MGIWRNDKFMLSGGCSIFSSSLPRKIWWPRRWCLQENLSMKKMWSLFCRTFWNSVWLYTILPELKMNKTLLCRHPVVGLSAVPEINPRGLTTRGIMNLCDSSCISHDRFSKWSVKPSQEFIYSDGQLIDIHWSWVQSNLDGQHIVMDIVCLVHLYAKPNAYILLIYSITCLCYWNYLNL